jgi:hypothetical protein
MTEVTKPGILKGKRSRFGKLKTSDIIILGILLVVTIVLLTTLYGKLTLKRDVHAARVVSDKVVADIANRDGTAARELGSKKFKSSYSAPQLTKQFNAIKLVTGKTPTVDRQTVADWDHKTVLIIYKYPPKLANQPYYIRVAVTNNDGTWQLTNISGSADEAGLIVK